MDAADLLHRVWGIKGKIKKLAGYEDKNYYVQTDDKEYLLKISQGPLDHQIQMQVQAMEFMDYEIKLHEDSNYTARLMPWKKGVMWADAAPKTPDLLFDLGVKAAQHYLDLAPFHHDAAYRKDFQWDLAQSQWIIEDLEIMDSELRVIIQSFLEKFRCLWHKYNQLPKSVIHNDMNDYNILVEGQKVTGFIDYGDMCFSQRINEVAILLAYGMMDWEVPLDAAHEILKGFTSKCTLEQHEVECLYTLIAMRLCVSLVSSQKGIVADPNNKYLLISRKPALALLKKLYHINEQFATYKFKDACGLQITDLNHGFEKWVANASISPVCPLESFYNLDLSVGSLELGHESLYNDARAHEDAINVVLKAEGKSVAIGSYDEVRPLYSSDDFTEKGNEGQRWRTVHIGLDFFQKAGTKVFAFASGKVHSIAYNEGDKNYGNTVILKHECCYTLYGHLSSKTLKHLQVGQQVEAGEVIAWFGEPHENGNWAPHLHFQIILDMLDYKNDFPGVCFVEDRKLWTTLCPDPRPYLGIAPEHKVLADADEIAAKRSENLGKSYSLSYDKPLHIVRAHGAYLYNQAGRKYLDCVNNVPHVGHQNINVIKAATQQMQLLNTNTRYLHQNIVNLAEKLTASLPENLKVCHFVNSGSEANELALRMARIATERHGIVAMEHGYHGNTSLCVDISSYKFNGEGGAGQKDFIQLVPMPDPVRLSERNSFALDPSIELPAAFIHESILSCGGQVVLPDRFFKDLYSRFKEDGLVMIADEVQTGLGRVGEHMWAFESEGIIPDIVTIGKPFGNGHPLAAVVCTEKIADAFHNGMEYFNTFGGNPVSCAIGLAVLEEVEKEGLQKHALFLGQFIKERLTAMKEEFSIIADVRGRGLFLGWEFADPTTMEPLAAKASFFVNEMKRFGILLSTDGPYHNVVKFKPPMVFTKENAEYMLHTMNKVLKYT